MQGEFGADFDITLVLTCPSFRVHGEFDAGYLHDTGVDWSLIVCKGSLVQALTLYWC